MSAAGLDTKHCRPVTAMPALSKGLRLAAAPIFAVLALLSALGGTPMGNLCAAASGGPVNSMALMYALMSVFHVPAWLKWTSAAPSP
jgi:hypothetical protein